jgi:opine dehydrogenase
MKKVTVLGGGNGAHAAAADLTLKGFEVSLFSRWSEDLKPLRGQGGIRLVDPTGERFVSIHQVCDTMEEALGEAEIILVVVPAMAHDDYAHACASHLRKDQILVLNPGSTGGALAFRKILKEKGMKDIPVCETNTLTYICRLTGPAEVKVSSRSKVQFASLPGKKTKECFEAFNHLYPESKERTNVLETSLTNINAILHPPGMILNAGWIEFTKGNFSYYCEGTTPAVAKLMEAVDQERMALCRRLNYPSERFLDFFYQAGSTSEGAYRSGSLYRALQESEPNRFIRAPENLSYRFLAEDIPYGLVPMADLGTMLGVTTPVINALIDLASLINETDYRRTGRTLGKMGIQGMGLDQLLDCVEQG